MVHKALSTLSQLKKVRLSQKSATVAENGEIRRLSHFSATVWTGFKDSYVTVMLNKRRHPIDVAVFDMFIVILYNIFTTTKLYCQ